MPMVGPPGSNGVTKGVSESLPSVGVFVKICGIKSVTDALHAVQAGADAVGFVFAPSSRLIDVEAARTIVQTLPPTVLAVGVFRNHDVRTVTDIVGRVGLGCAQLHGCESPADTRAVVAGVRRVIKAFAVTDPTLSAAADHRADAILLDAATPGSGETFDWAMAVNVARGHRMLLAGGLHADNVADAVAAVAPWGVDVSTGVESAPGRKDPGKVTAFIAAARAATSAALPHEDWTPIS
jgi:phosphoribosylanthranilate isomerase